MTFELDWLKKWNLYSPEAVALKDGDTGQTYTYSQFYQAALAGAEKLRQWGVRKGDRVAVLATNELEYVILFFAAQRLGAILVPINFRLTQREVEHIVQDSDPVLILFQEPYRENVGIFSRKSFLLQDFADALTVHAGGSPLREDFSSSPEDAVMIIYTSGTTGAPKGAVLTQQMLFWNSVNTTLRLNLDQKDCAVIFLPFFHTGGWNVLTTPFYTEVRNLFF